MTLKIKRLSKIDAARALDMVKYLFVFSTNELLTDVSFCSSPLILSSVDALKSYLNFLNFLRFSCIQRLIDPNIFFWQRSLVLLTLPISAVGLADGLLNNIIIIIIL